MRRFIIPACVVVAAVALLALLTYGVSNHTDTASIDYQVSSKHYPTAPDYTRQLPMVDGAGTRSLASFRGRVVVVNIWASWCEPCHAEAPLLARMQKTLTKQGGTFVGVTYETSAAQAQQFNRQYGITYPNLRDVSGNFSRDFGTFLVPETFIISRRGKIEALKRGPVDRGWLTTNLKRVLAEKA